MATQTSRTTRLILALGILVAGCDLPFATWPQIDRRPDDPLDYGRGALAAVPAIDAGTGSLTERQNR